jgi:hypothetical protein
MRLRLSRAVMANSIALIHLTTEGSGGHVTTDL